MLRIDWASCLRRRATCVGEAAPSARTGEVSDTRLLPHPASNSPGAAGAAGWRSSGDLRRSRSTSSLASITGCSGASSASRSV
eukprot:scaffold29153_cov107-Isochrysis_galbana.AAC.7